MCLIKKPNKENNNTEKQKDGIQNTLLKRIVKIAKNEKEIFISTIQRKCNVGYVKAKEHIDYLVQNNIFTKIGEDTPKYTINEEQYNKFKETVVK